MVDKDAVQEAVESGDERKIYFYFAQIADTCGYRKHRLYEDWKQESIIRAFRYLPSYTPERGKAWSYFYSIIRMQLMYEYRRFKSLKKFNMIEEVGLTNNIPAYDDAEIYVSIGDKIYDKNYIKEVYDKATKYDKWHKSKGVKKILHIEEEK